MRLGTVRRWKRSSMQHYRTGEHNFRYPTLESDLCHFLVATPGHVTNEDKDVQTQAQEMG